MSQNLPDNYCEEVPEHVDKTQSEWEELGYHGQYHHAERDTDRVMMIKNRRLEKKKYWLTRIKAEQGCKLCGEDEAACLVYHHLENKEFNLGGAAYRDKSRDDLKNEINKCVVLCANCHRKHHAGLVEL